MEPIIVYNEATDTLRQMPQNYMLAKRIGTMWHIDFDGAANKNLVRRILEALFEHKNRFGTGLNLLAAVTPNEKFQDKTVAIIDHEINEVFIYDVSEESSSEDIESFLCDVNCYTSDDGIIEKPLHRLGSCSWGEFNGIINDFRNG